MPRLVLLRHAKSAYPDETADHDRPLSARGDRESLVAGVELAERFSAVDLVLVSTALRAQQTWHAVSSEVVAVREENRAELYLASVASLAELVRGLSAEADSVLVVAHNEGLEQLATLLTGVPVTMKTSTFAILRSDRPWSGWQPGSATLDEVVVAR